MKFAAKSKHPRSTRHLSVEEAVSQQAKAELGTAPVKESHRLIVERKFGVLDIVLTPYEMNAIKAEQFRIVPIREEYAIAA